MKHSLLLFLALFTTQASAVDLRLNRNLSSGGQNCEQVNISGTMTDELCLASAGFTLGTSAGTQSHTINGQALTLTGATGGNSIITANAVGTTGLVTPEFYLNLSGVNKWSIGSSTYFGSNDSLYFYSNSVNTGGVTQAGAWTLGASGGTQTHTVNGAMTWNPTSSIGEGGYTKSAYSSSVAATSGTLDLDLGACAGFSGILSVDNTTASNAGVRSMAVYAVMGRLANGTTTITSLGTQTGGSGAASFTLGNPSNNILRLTNTSSGATQVGLTYFGLCN